MKNNFIVFNFWEKYEDENVVIGTSQLSLNQFFIAYRNKAIADTLLQNRLPVTISDWWEPICSPVDGKIYGQMKVLVATGTPAQIQNLEVERGLKDDSSSVTYVPIVSELRNLNQESNMSTSNASTIKHPNRRLNKTLNNDQRINNRNNVPPLATPKRQAETSRQSEHAVQTNNSEEVEKLKKIDIGVQSEVDVEEFQNRTESQSENIRNNALETLISHLIEHKHKNVYVENGTNTEDLMVNSTQAHKQLNNEKVDSLVSNNINKLSQTRNETNTQLRKTSDLLDYLSRTLSLDNEIIRPPPPSPAEDESNFKARIVVEGALHLPHKRKCKTRKIKKKGITYEDVLPSTYVTFETVSSTDLHVTPVVHRSANPRWDYKCDVTLPGEILTNGQKRLIFKVWRKNNPNSSEPNLQVDAIIGFAALDLSVLLSGLPSVQGWFNIVDFTFKCNGQIKIHITPLENLSRFNPVKSTQSKHEIHAHPKNYHEQSHYQPQPQHPLLELREEPSELLNRALKRKFTELEEITQRLRTRLADVTRDDSDTSNDEFADEFEKDINSIPAEDDYNMINLEEDDTVHQSLIDMPNNYLLKQTTYEKSVPSNYSKGTILPKLLPSDSAYSSTYMSDKTEATTSHLFASNNFNAESPDSESQIFQRNSSNNLLLSGGGGDSSLKAGRQRIDQLLEKLTQLSAVDNTENIFSSRYVSGCSVNQEMPSNHEKPESNFNIDDVLNPALFNQLCSVDVDCESNRTKVSDELYDSSSNAQIENDYSTSSLLTQFSTYRQAPDGAGYAVDSNNIGKSK